METISAPLGLRPLPDLARAASAIVERCFDARPTNQVPYWFALTTDDAEELRRLLRALRVRLAREQRR